jgi:hypothetical protein
MIQRRSFLKLTAQSAALAGLGDFAFLAQLPRVSTAETKIDPALVRLRPDIEPLARLLEETPRERAVEEVALRIRNGLSYRELVTALLLAGARSIQPRPIGFKFHAVLAIHAAHLASVSSPDTDRWLPVLWAVDLFKSSQAANAREGGWSMGPVDEAAVPPAHKARRAFIEAMDNWDEAAADAAITGLVRSAGAHEIFEIICRYGVRDFRELGHKEIYTANAFRLLEIIGWQNAEPVLRSLAYAILDRVGDRDTNPAKADLPADRPFRRNRENIRKIREDWLEGKPDPEATAEMLRAIRDGSSIDTSEKAIELLNRGAAPQSIFDALFEGAGELLMRAPGILSLHATTFTNAAHYAWQHASDDETRRLLLAQNAAFMPLYRGNSTDKGLHIDALEPAAITASGDGAIEEIFADISRDRLLGARKILARLKENPDPKPLVSAARRLIFTKGRDAHDYKYSSAVLEDYNSMSPPWRDRYLAASAFYLRGSGETDNTLVQRIRSALAG